MYIKPESKSAVDVYYLHTKPELPPQAGLTQDITLSH